MNTIEALGTTQSHSDMWSEMNNDKFNCGAVFYTFPPEVTNTFRLIGPFQVCERMYTKPDGNVPVSKKELYEISNHNTETYNTVKHKIEEFHKVPRPSDKNPRAGNNPRHTPVSVSVNNSLNNIRNNLDFLNNVNLFGNAQEPADFVCFTKEQKLNYIERLYNDDAKWQKVLLINALFLSPVVTPQLHIIALNHNIMSEMRSGIGDKSTAPISGLYAHDVSIRKSGNGLQTKYHCKMSAQASHLSNETIRYILRHGLWDISKTMNKINSGATSYIYRNISNYKMPSELQGEVFSHYDENEGQHFEKVVKTINDLPENAIENKVMRGNSIGQIEL